MSKKITGLTAAAASDMAATTSYMEVAINTTTTPASRKVSLGVLRDWLASAATGLAAVAVTVASLGVGTAALAQNNVTISGSVTVSGGAAHGIRYVGTQVAAANGDQLRGVFIAPTLTPGAFTGLIFKGVVIAGQSLAGFTSPASSYMLDIGALVGQAGMDAFGIRIAPPTTGDNNYLIAHTTPGTFSVTAAGVINGSAYQVGGVAGADFSGAVATKSFTVVKGIVTAVA